LLLKLENSIERDIGSTPAMANAPV
jgi:hypothetical protein